MNEAQDLHALTGAFALDALTGPEHLAFTAHLERCEACAREVAGFSAAAARLAGAVSLPAPAPMKHAVMNRIDSVRQLPPPTRAERPVRLLSAFTRRIGPLAVAAGIAAVASLGAVAIWQHQQVQQARTQAHSAQEQVREASAVLAAPDTRTVHGRTSTGATTSVATSARLNRSVFAATGLAPAPAGKTYQLWFDDHGTMRPAGLIHQDGTVLMQGDPSRARAVGLTLEPDGGSPQPTTSPLVLLSLPA